MLRAARTPHAPNCPQVLKDAPSPVRNVPHNGDSNSGLSCARGPHVLWHQGHNAHGCQPCVRSGYAHNPLHVLIRISPDSEAAGCRSREKVGGCSRKPMQSTTGTDATHAQPAAFSQKNDGDVDAHEGDAKEGPHSPGGWSWLESSVAVLNHNSQF